MSNESKLEKSEAENELMRELLEKYSSQYIDIIEHVRETNEKSDQQQL